MADADVNPPKTISAAASDDDAGDDDAVDDDRLLGAADTNTGNVNASGDTRGIVGEEA